ncbi:MAG: SDR family oxidoreductase [Cyanobacteria bacterium P01_D01_bin.71]
MQTSVLVAGGTGGCGRLVVQRLLDQGKRVRVLTRSPQRAAQLGSVEVCQGTALYPEDCRRAVESCQAVVCTLGATVEDVGSPLVDGDGVINLAQCAIDAEVERFILVSSLGVGDSWHWMPYPVRWFFKLHGEVPILNEKARSEAYVRSSRITWSILRPGFLTNASMQMEPLLLSPAGRVLGVTSRQAVADVAVRCLDADRAIAQTFTVVDGWLRNAVWRGEPMRLDVPWQVWETAQSSES